MKFWVTEEEKRLIDEKMAQLPTKRYGAYLRKMAIDGYIIQVDTTDIKEMTKALGSIGRLLPGCTDLEDLLRRLQREGYELKRGKYIFPTATVPALVLRSQTPTQVLN